MVHTRSLCLVSAAGLVIGCATERDSRVPYAGPASASAADDAGSTGGEDPEPGLTSGDPGTSSSLPPDASATDTPPADSADASTGEPGADSTGPGPSSDTTDTGKPSALCDDVAGSDLVPPVTCDGPGGNTTTEIPPNSMYSTSWFGCYFDQGGDLVEDPFDNCEFACGNQGLCPAGQSGPQCEANLRWFAADADRYGCGGRIRVTNCANGNAVVLTTLDRGPNCNSVEKACDTPVLDMSHDAMVFLFDGGTYGGCDHQTVVVEAVAADTPLGPA